MVANNQSIIYDIDAQTETILPDIPNGVRVTAPTDGSAILLPLSPPDYIPEVLVCGGSDIDDRTPAVNLSTQHPATSQCSRIMLTPEGIARGWEVEHMLEPRTLNELLHIPNGQILISNGASKGFSGFRSDPLTIPDPIGNSNADDAALIPSIYTPGAPLGQRISNAGMPNATIARMYHSTITLTPQGNFLVAGSNPNNSTMFTEGVKFPSEFRVQMLDPPFMFVERPKILDMPRNIGFAKSVTVPISLPNALNRRGANVQGTRRAHAARTPPLTPCYACLFSCVDGPWLLDARLPHGRAACLHGRDDLKRRPLAHVRHAAQREGVPARTCDDLPDRRRCHERGRVGDGGQWAIASRCRVNVQGVKVPVLMNEELRRVTERSFIHLYHY